MSHPEYVFTPWLQPSPHPPAGLHSSVLCNLLSTHQLAILSLPTFFSLLSQNHLEFPDVASLFSHTPFPLKFLPHIYTGPCTFSS